MVTWPTCSLITRVKRAAAAHASACGGPHVSKPGAPDARGDLEVRRVRLSLSGQHVDRDRVRLPGLEGDRPGENHTSRQLLSVELLLAPVECVRRRRAVNRGNEEHRGDDGAATEKLGRWR